MANTPPSTGNSPQEELRDFDPAEQSPQPGLHRRPRAKRTSKLPRQIGASLAIALLACVGIYAGFVYNNSAALRKYLRPIIDNVNIGSEFPGTNSINLMIIGRDYDYSNQDQVIKTHARSDMLMIAHVDFVNKTANILSIPRDTAVQIPGHGVTKINAAHAYGGPSLAGATIQQNFGIKADHYIALDFDGFQQAINLIGGVDCTVDRKMDYDDNWGHLHIHLLPGFQHLNGEQAMDFVRFRHADSDLIRTKRQQALLAQLKVKLIQPQILALLPQLLDTIDKHVNSDLSDDQKVALGKFLHDLPKQSVQIQTCPSIEGARLVETDYTQASPLIKSWFGVDMPQPVAVEMSSLPRTKRHHHLRIDRPIDVT